MSSEPSARWLDWTRRLQGIAQTGLTFTENAFDIERYQAIRRIAAEMIAAAAGSEDVPAVLGLLVAESGYATPKVDVRGVVFNAEGHLLLVRERSDGRWTLPGGWADVGSTPAENVVREIREEAGFETRAVKLLAVYDPSRHPHPPKLHHVYKLFVRCEIIGGAAAAEGTLETAGVGFFPPGGLPPELSSQRATASQLARMFEHYQQADLPTDFD